MKANQIFIFFFIAMVACNKSKYLDEKPDKALLVPRTLSDLNALLNNRDLFYKAPTYPVMSDGDFIISDDAIGAIFRQAQNAYRWKPDIHEGSSAGDWDVPYQQVFYTNVVLDELGKMEYSAAEQDFADEIKGTAYFYRAYAFHQLALAFSVTYDPSTAQVAKGVPLPLSSDVNLRHGRGTVEQTYRQIIADLEAAVKLVPEKGTNAFRPGTASVNGLLARVYLSMENYGQALQYADAALKDQDSLIDYNGLAPTTGLVNQFPLPFVTPNPEILYYNVQNTNFANSQFVYIDSVLYASYQEHDLRKTMFFNDVQNYKGSYSGNTFLFGGLTTGEMYLIRAECHARTGNTSGAMEDINTLRRHRIHTAYFSEMEAADPEDALRKVLTERRKELAGRGIRWSDLKRLNKDERFRTDLRRVSQGITYTLPAGDARYMLPIPDDEIRNNQIEQNKR